MQWDMVGVIVVLAGLMGTVCMPVVKLTKAISTLTATCRALEEQVARMKEKNSRSRSRLWEHNQEQDALLHDHETRIVRLEEGDRK